MPTQKIFDFFFFSLVVVPSIRGVIFSGIPVFSNISSCCAALCLVWQRLTTPPPRFQLLLEVVLQESILNFLTLIFRFC